MVKLRTWKLSFIYLLFSFHYFYFDVFLPLMFLNFFLISVKIDFPLLMGLCFWSVANFLLALLYGCWLFRLLCLQPCFAFEFWFKLNIDL